MRNKHLLYTVLLFLFPPTFTNNAISSELIVDRPTFVAQNEPTLPPQDIPMGQDPSEPYDSLLPEDDTSNDSEDLFGTKGGGYIHPFLSIAGEYTDNIFNVNTNEEHNFLTTLTPGIWLAFPKTKEVPLAIAPNNTTSGGLRIALPDYQGFERFNAYLLGALDFLYYSEYSELDDYDATVEGYLKFNLRSGLSFQIIDHYTRTQDRFDVGNIANAATGEIDTVTLAGSGLSVRRYYSNIALGTINWDITEKIGLKAELSNFFLDYNDIDDKFLSRDDNALSLFGIFTYSPKTSLFLEYKYIDVRYDTETTKDNEQDFIYGGISWIASVKTQIGLKAGYQTREYKDAATNEISENSSESNNDALALELDVKYKITSKTGTALTVHHKLDETDSAVALDKRVLGAKFRYNQEFSENFIGILDLSYENAVYNQLIKTERHDKTYSVRPALQYIFNDLLMAEIAYSWEQRDSTDELFPYETNIISISLNSAL